MKCSKSCAGISSFEPVPFISRVVFMATPHRGSEMSRGVVGRVGTSLISDPDHIHKLLYQTGKGQPGRLRFAAISPVADQYRDARAQLADPDGTLEDAATAPADGIKFHSIIGSLRPDRGRRSTDGVVPYASSPLMGSCPRRSCDPTMASRRIPRPFARCGNILREHVGVARDASGRARGPQPPGRPRLRPSSWNRPSTSDKRPGLATTSCETGKVGSGLRA